MKIIDTKNGKILGINVVDLVILAVIVFLIFSFGTHIIKKGLEFSGDEMYNAIQTYTTLESKGFLIKAHITGKYIGTEEPFDAEGIIISTRGGAFIFRINSNTTVSVGGKRAYSEEVAASKIILQPLYKYSAPIMLQDKEFSSYSEFIEYLENLKKEKEADDLFITCDISFVNFNESAQEVLSKLEGMYYAKYVGPQEISEREVIARIILANLEELKKLNIHAEKIVISPIRFSDLKSYAAYNKKPKIKGAVAVDDLL